MRQPVKQIAYKYCVNFARNWISVPNIVHKLTLSLRCKYCIIRSCSIFPDAINSIRRLAASLAASDCKPMTSVFYDVIRLESVRGRSNLLIEGHFWRFWGKNVVGHRVDPKKALPYVIRRGVFWDISREIPCTGCLSRRVRKKIKIKKRGLIFHVFRQALPYGRLAQILGYVFVWWT